VRSHDLVGWVSLPSTQPTNFNRSSSIGTMYLKIASICITHQALLLTRNLKDFGQILELNAQDWTI